MFSNLVSLALKARNFMKKAEIPIWFEVVMTAACPKLPIEVV
jgi:hypothetical protein